MSGVDGTFLKTFSVEKQHKATSVNFLTFLTKTRKGVRISLPFSILFSRVCNNNTMTTTYSPNTSPRIHEVPAYIFVKDEEMMSVDPSKIATENTKKSDSEMTAVAALSILVGSPASSPVDDKERIQDEEEEKEFEIPQKLTKTGRKRAVPFTLKVRTS
jgi:hypothetical protein